VNEDSALLTVENLGLNFGNFRAVRDLSFSVAKGRTFGIVGESGSGKSTTARLVLRLLKPSAGRVLFRGRDLASLGREALRRERRHMQMIFQDPFGSLNPYMTVGELLGEPLEVHGVGEAAARPRQIVDLLDEVGLPAAAIGRYPHEFSGGQRQRIAIARALATGPDMIVADEPVSALDVSVQAQVLNLLRDLQERHATTLLFISHDLRVVEFMCDEIAVMYLGQIVEQGPRDAIYATPRHPYTKALLDAIPGRGLRQPATPTDTGSAIGAGCPFRPRCPAALDRCASEAPALREATLGHHAACHLVQPA
jgi:oligopeptide/dipeptide ABC transporter ATP-binding protein